MGAEVFCLEIGIKTTEITIIFTIVGYWTSRNSAP
jgi:hypothetical protein